MLEPWYIERVRTLIGCSLVNIHRVCDLICFDFESSEVGAPAYALHAETLVRIIIEGKVVACSHDMFTPSPHCIDELFKYDESDSLFDFQIQQNLDVLIGQPITNVTVLSYGDLSIDLERNTTISVSVNSSDSDPEMWRLLSSDETPSLICSANQFILSEDPP